MIATPLSSIKESPYRLLLDAGHNIRSSPQQAVAALLFSVGVDNSEVICSLLKDYSLNLNLVTTLELIQYVGQSVSMAGCLSIYNIGLLGASSSTEVDKLSALLPSTQSEQVFNGFSKQLHQTNKDTFTALLSYYCSYFDYPQLSPVLFESPSSLLDWARAARPSLKTRFDYLEEHNYLALLESLTSSSYTGFKRILNYLCTCAYAHYAVGADYKQLNYF
jgi:hypothetical protein